MSPRRLGAAAAFGLMVAAPAFAHDAHRHAGHQAQAAPGAAKVVLADAPLIDQTGRRVRLAQDVIGGRIAIVNFIYTTCTTVCPVSSATLSQVQERLGEALGKDVVLVSITVDPVRDTPERMREYAARYGARQGWTWLTGAKRDIDAGLRGFGAYAPNYDDHPAMVLVGDGAAGRWVRFFGFPSAEELLARARALVAARAAATQVVHHHAEE
jgi:protein SCO1